MPSHKKWEDRHQVVFKQNVSGHSSDGKTRTFKKDTTYIVTSYERSENGSATYRFADGSWFYSRNGRVADMIQYTDGYKDFLHREYEIEDQEIKYGIDRADRLFERDSAKRKAIEDKYNKNS